VPTPPSRARQALRLCFEPIVSCFHNKKLGNRHNDQEISGKEDTGKRKEGKYLTFGLKYEGYSIEIFK
jgi:hypothetical protein